MEENPYTAPTAKIDNPYAKQFIVPQKIYTKIRNAYICGCISGTLTLILTLLAISGSSIGGLNAWSFIDVGLIFGLTFGIYKNSRTCAILLLIYFTSEKILVAISTGTFNGFLLSIVFIFFYVMGVIGTFEYHKSKKKFQENLDN